MNDDYLNLISSSRLLPTTADALKQRVKQAASYEPVAIHADLYPVLQAVLARLLPQSDREEPIDIAARLDKQHAEGKGNGWRYADMPEDRDALERGLSLLESQARLRYRCGFTSMNPAQQDEFLLAVQAGEARWQSLNSKHWFEDLVADATSIFVSHPETLAEMGFSGFAFLPRWEKIGVNDREPWEPAAQRRPDCNLES